MKHLGAVLAVVLLVGSSGESEAEELKGASLAGLSRLGAVIVTASSDTVSEDEARRAVESRLARAKIPVDGDPGPELLVSISAERSKSERGSCQCGTFRVILSLRETVTLERAPDQGVVAAITWRTGGAIRRFSTTAPRLSIMETLEESISDFLRSVSSDSQQADHDNER